jgi:hypothetical protein
MSWAEAATGERGRSSRWFSAAWRARYVIFFHDATPPRAAFPQGYDMPSGGPPRAEENGKSRTAMSLAVQKISLSNRCYVSEWLGSPCPIPQPV